MCRRGSSIGTTPTTTTHSTPSSSSWISTGFRPRSPSTRTKRYTMTSGPAACRSATTERIAEPNGDLGALIPKGPKNVTVAKDFLKYAVQPNVLNEYLKGGLGRWAIPMPEIAKEIG